MSPDSTFDLRAVGRFPWAPPGFAMRAVSLAVALLAAACDAAGTPGDALDAGDVDARSEDVDGRGDASAPPDADTGAEEPVPPAECGGLTYVADLSFANLCLLPQPNVDTWTDGDVEGWGWNTLANALERHQSQCSSLEGDFDDAPALRAWQDEGRLVLRRILRLDAELWPELPLYVRELETVEEGATWTLTTIDWVAAPGQRIPSDLYVPRAPGPHPAIVFVHGHDDGGRAAASGRAPWTADSNYHRAGARRLADAGFVVLAPDVRSFGETGSWSQHRRFAEIMTFEGRVAYGVFTADALRAVDVLLTFDDVDPERIGMAGVSMGGQIALYATLFDPRVRATVVAGHLGRFNRLLLESRQDPCQYIPMLDRFFDIPEVAMLAAPSPVLFVTGDADPLYPLSEATEAWERLARAWRIDGAEHAVELSVEAGGHAWFPEPAEVFFTRHLRR